MGGDRGDGGPCPRGRDDGYGPHRGRAPGEGAVAAFDSAREAREEPTSTRGGSQDRV